MTYLDRYNFWCNAGLPEEVQAELMSIRKDDEELKGRFGGDLQFGTAGMRGIMGAGSNRLNRYTVRRAAQGMAAWLSGTDLPQKAAIGYDSRHNSQLFAEICAVAFAEKGIKRGRMAHITYDHHQTDDSSNQHGNPTFFFHRDTSAIAIFLRVYYNHSITQRRLQYVYFAHYKG